MPSIDETLAERGARYGEFIDHANVTQSIKASIASGGNWDTLDDDMKECLEMVAHKIGRIVNGDPNYVDSWTDIIGYTRLVEKRLIQDLAKLEAAKNRAEIPTKEITDTELAAIIRNLAPGLHVIHVAEESGDTD